MKNYYPDKPIIDFSTIHVEMGAIITLIKAVDVPTEVKRSAYIFIRNETANGKSVICGTNPGGVQSDSGEWPEKWEGLIKATTNKAENRTGKLRGFVVFNTLNTGIAFVCERLQARGLYIGGTTHKITNVTITTPPELAKQYYAEWVEGDAKYHLTNDELNEFDSMYNQAEKIFTD